MKKIIEVFIYALVTVLNIVVLVSFLDVLVGLIERNTSSDIIGLSCDFTTVYIMLMIYILSMIVFYKVFK